MKLTSILLISLLFLASCTIDSNDKKGFISNESFNINMDISCKKDTDCKIIIIQNCCSETFTSVNISNTGEVIYPRSCINIDCEPPKYQPKKDDYKSSCESNVCKLKIK